MHERDRTALLTLIVRFGKGITESDGGGVLLLDRRRARGRTTPPLCLRAGLSAGPADFRP